MTYTPKKTRPVNGGEQRWFKFDNGYQASVIRGPYTYGGVEGFFELAVKDRNGRLTYDTPITNDVIGWLTEEQVQETLARIAALPEAPS